VHDFVGINRARLSNVISSESQPQSSRSLSSLLLVARATTGDRPSVAGSLGMDSSSLDRHSYLHICHREMGTMDEHRGIAQRSCPRCHAEMTVAWLATSAAPDGTDADGDATSNQGPLRAEVSIERRLPEQQKQVGVWLGLAVRPGETVPRVITRYLYSAQPEHELTLAESVADIPRMLGDVAGEVVSGLIAPTSDCSECTRLSDLTGELFGAMVAMMVMPIVAPIVALLDWVSLIGALLPGGDIDDPRVGMGLIRHWTGAVIALGLGPYLEPWTEAIRLCGAVGMANLIRKEAIRQEAARLGQRMVSPDGGPRQVPRQDLAPSRPEAPEASPDPDDEMRVAADTIRNSPLYAEWPPEAEEFDRSAVQPSRGIAPTAMRFQPNQEEMPGRAVPRPGSRKGIDWELVDQLSGLPNRVRPAGAEPPVDRSVRALTVSRLQPPAPSDRDASVSPQDTHRSVRRA
jgi:hypothetical protein